MLTAPSAVGAVFSQIGRLIEGHVLRISANNLDVTSREGIVTLEGTVKHLLARDRTVELTRQIKGIRSVIDRLSVRETNKTALAYQPSIASGDTPEVQVRDATR